VGFFPAWLPSFALPWTDPTGEAECYPIKGSEGSEDTIMGHCRYCVNNQFFFPILSDCHTACKRILGDLGYEVPPHQYFNDDDFDMPEGIWVSPL
jgi:hypothetical protein